MPLQIIRQDITKMQVDAIVNTTNEEMVGYSGVDLAIHTLAGADLDEECGGISPLGLGEAKITGGYNLPCKHVIHTSGPVWQGGLQGESLILRSCYIECLKVAVANGCQTVAFPLISSGVYNFPKDQVLKFAVQTITEFLFEHELTVYLCVHDKDSYTFSKQLFDDISEFISDEYVDEHDRDFYIDDEDADLYTDEDADLYTDEECIEADKCLDLFSLKSIRMCSEIGESLEEYVRDMDKPFAYRLFDLIDEKGITDVECYKRANVDKRTFSKIKSNPTTYKPSKQTAVAFAIALELSLSQTQELLATAGLALSGSLVFDKIIRYFIQKGIYNIFEINEALFEFDQPLLGNFS